MARQARVESETTFYHVMMRGNNRENIFNTESKKRRFMEYLSAEAVSGAVQVVGWCLMDNHVHLVLKGQMADLAQAIKRINIKYAMGFNTLEGRIGHVFQDRFKSEPIEDDNHLLAVIRYVHNNPVKAKITLYAAAYAWSSYTDYLEGSELLDTELRNLVLGHFSNTSEFETFHKQRDDEGYLEMKEDAEQYRMERAQELISAFCRANGLQEATDFKRSTNGLDTLIGDLLNYSHLSYRKIAELAGVSYSRVNQISGTIKMNRPW